MDKNGNEVPMDLEDESDGTRRLIEYMPLIYSILKGDAVYIVDEIERSIHPILIKSIISKISESHEAKGQLILQPMKVAYSISQYLDLMRFGSRKKMLTNPPNSIH